MENIPEISIERAVALLLSAERESVHIIECQKDMIFKKFVESLVHDKNIPTPIYIIDASIFTSIKNEDAQIKYFRKLIIDKDINNDSGKEIIAVTGDNSGVPHLNKVTVIIKHFDFLKNITQQQIPILVGANPAIKSLSEKSLVLALSSGGGRISPLIFGKRKGIVLKLSLK